MPLFNFLPKGKDLDSSKLKAFADDKVELAGMIDLCLKRKKILWEKEEMLIFFFQKPFSEGSFKLGIVWKRVRLYIIY